MTERGSRAFEHLRTWWVQHVCPCYTKRYGVQMLSSCTRDKAMTTFRGICTHECLRCAVAEFLAMLIFVLLGVGSTINWGAGDEQPRPPDQVLVSLCFGLCVVTMVHSFGHVSGAHINPAVTAAMLVTKKLSLTKAVSYLMAQCLGATAGAALLYGITPRSVRGGMGVTMVNNTISVGRALVVEIFITFQLVLTVFASCDPKRNALNGSSSLAIGLSVCCGHLFAMPYTGASMNPARSFGPAIVTWTWENHWVFWVGPVLGGVVAAILYENLVSPAPELKKRYSEAFYRTPLSSTKYLEVQASTLNAEHNQLIKEPLFTVMDLERSEGRERKMSTEALSSV
ncbi:aquaporin-4-like [Lampris incognitus]|uniref:aquaporin-4-like n=1 Tax=Lampris incognitus TaxID=2546036 RepID=UPI0024B549A7|nr:aquaporin-4-like [Lampris incognitus]